MPAPAAAALAAVKWGTVLKWARILLTVAASIRPRLTDAEWAELARLVGRTKGRPANLSAREQARVRELVAKAMKGGLPEGVAIRRGPRLRKR